MWKCELFPIKCLSSQNLKSGITYRVVAEDSSVDIWEWPHRSWVQTSVICVAMSTRHLLTADPKRSDRNAFCAPMTLKLGPCIIYQSDGVVTFIRKLLQHSLLFSTCIKHFNLHNILITQCHGAACHPHFLIYCLPLFFYSYCLFPVWHSPCLSLYFHLTFTPLISSLSLPLS